MRSGISILITELKYGCIFCENTRQWYAGVCFLRRSINCGVFLFVMKSGCANFILDNFCPGGYNENEKNGIFKKQNKGE